VGVKSQDPLRPLQNFILSIAIKSRSTYFAISPRNIINCVEMLKQSAGSGFKNTPSLENVPPEIVNAMKGAKIDPAIVRATILATMLGNVVTKNDGPDKVKALLWDEA
jgi:hypothetical protein